MEPGRFFEVGILKNFPIFQITWFKTLRDLPESPCSLRAPYLLSIIACKGLRAAADLGVNRTLASAAAADT